MYKAKIYVQLKPSVLDPQGKVITKTLHDIGYNSVKDTRISKYIELCLNGTDIEQIKNEVEEICQNVLANPNTENYRYELEKI